MATHNLQSAISVDEAFKEDFICCIQFCSFLIPIESNKSPIMRWLQPTMPYYTMEDGGGGRQWLGGGDLKINFCLPTHKENSHFQGSSLPVTGAQLVFWAALLASVYPRTRQDLCEMFHLLFITCSWRGEDIRNSFSVCEAKIFFSQCLIAMQLKSSPCSKQELNTIAVVSAYESTSSLHAPS